jgi:hypothetical protein
VCDCFSYFLAGSASGEVRIFDLKWQADGVPFRSLGPQSPFGLVGGALHSTSSSTAAARHGPPTLLAVRRDGLQRVLSVRSFNSVPIAAVTAQEASGDDGMSSNAACVAVY